MNKGPCASTEGHPNKDFCPNTVAQLNERPQPNECPCSNKGPYPNEEFCPNTSSLTFYKVF